MAKTPTPSAAPMTDDAGAADPGAEDAGAAGADAGDDAPEEEVLLTVCKEPDGTYSLIKGDEEEADGADLAGSAAVAGSPAASNKQTFDSKGALLKAILDILNEDEAGDGGEPGDQFQAGFDENAPARAAAPMPQKF